VVISRPRDFRRPKMLWEIQNSVSATAGLVKGAEARSTQLGPWPGSCPAAQGTGFPAEESEWLRLMAQAPIPRHSNGFGGTRTMEFEKRWPDSVEKNFEGTCRAPRRSDFRKASLPADHRPRKR